jgi:DNA-binding protein H-NS
MMDMNAPTTLDQIDAEEAALVAQVIALRGRKAEVRERELGSATERAQALIDRYEITADKLTFPVPPSVPKYRDPLSDETWSGKGNAPLWTKGKPLEQFLNPEWVAKNARDEQAKAERDARKAKRAAKKAEEAAKVNKSREQIDNAGLNEVAGDVHQHVVTGSSTPTNDVNASTLATNGPSVQAEAVGHNDAVNTTMNDNDTVQHAASSVVANANPVPMIGQKAPAVVAS